MSKIDKISVALPQEMVIAIRRAVETGEYASSSEVVLARIRERSLQLAADSSYTVCGPRSANRRGWPLWAIT